MIPRDVSQNLLHGFHHPLPKSLNGVLVSERQNCAELQNVYQARVIDSSRLPRLLAVGWLSNILSLDCDHSQAIVFWNLGQQSIHKGFEAVTREGRNISKHVTHMTLIHTINRAKSALELLI